MIVFDVRVVLLAVVGGGVVGGLGDGGAVQCSVAEEERLGPGDRRSEEPTAMRAYRGYIP